MKRTSRLFLVCFLGLAPLAATARAQVPLPMTLEGPPGSFTERRPARVEFASEVERQRQSRFAAMVAMSGLNRTLLSKLTRGEGNVAFRRTAAAALDEIATLLPAALAVQSPVPEGERGALPRIRDDADRAAADTPIAAFRESNGALHAAAAPGEDFGAITAKRHHCIACHGAHWSY